MKLTIKTLKCCIIAVLCMSSLHLSAQNKFTTAQWQEDLNFLESVVHNDYPFLFDKVTQDEWDAAVLDLRQAIPKLKDHQIMVEFAKLVALFKYGHTSMRFSAGGVPYHLLPVNLYQFNDGIYVEGTNLENKAALGAKVIAVQGIPIAEALAKIKPVVSVENEQFFKAYGIYYLTIPEVLHTQGITNSYTQEVSFTLEKAGKQFAHTFTAGDPADVPTNYSVIIPDENWLSARDFTATPLYLKHLDKIYYYEYLPQEKTVYVRQSQVQDDPEKDIPSFYAEVFDFIEQNDVEKLVLDVRLNGGGNNYKNKAVVTGVIKSEKINQIGKFFVIIGRRTFSACQNLINELDTYTNAIFVGEPSSENINFYGDNRTHTLPNSKHQVRLSFAWWQDKPVWENAEWTTPHLAVDMSFKEYVNNQDPVLETALSYSGDDFILDPMDHLQNLFMQGKMDQVQVDAANMVKDQRYRFFDFEKSFNQAAENMMGSPQHQGAVFVMQMTIQLFPESAYSWKNLGEVYRISNDFTKAREAYNKALSLKPGGTLEDLIKQRLSQLN